MSDAESELSEERPELAEKLSELEILRQSLEQVKAKEKDIYDQFLRLNAEFQNFRKRSETQIVDSRRAGREDVLLKIIGLCDALAQAELSSKKATDVEALKKGLSLVRDQFEKFLADQGLQPIKAKGEKLDPNRHEAIARVVDAKLDDGMVIEEIQRGYTLNGQIVRPARVSVSAKPSESRTNESADEAV